MRKVLAWSADGRPLDAQGERVVELLGRGAAVFDACRERGELPQSRLLRGRKHVLVEGRESLCCCGVVVEGRGKELLGNVGILQRKRVSRVLGVEAVDLRGQHRLWPFPDDEQCAPGGRRNTLSWPSEWRLAWFRPPLTSIGRVSRSR